MSWLYKFSICLAIIFLIFAGDARTAVLDIPLEIKLNKASADDVFSIFLWFESQTDVKQLTASLDAESATLAKRHAVIIKSLQENSSATQGEIISLLDDGIAIGEVLSYHSFWIANFITVAAKRDFIIRIVNRPEISEVFEDFKIDLIRPIIDYETRSGGENPVITSVEDGLEAIGAPEMWAAGYTGEGRLVMNIDTGVDGNHPALNSRWIGNNGYPASQGWLDTTNPSSQYPYDSGGHGTHTMGTITGLGESTGDTVGVAFGAFWMAARAIVDGGNAAMAFQWGADPDGDPNTMHDVPDVISNSWSAIDLGCFETYWRIIDNVEAVGPVVVFSAGNDGPGTETVGSPANRQTSSTNAFAVGAVNGHNPGYPIASFSGRGPSLCDHITKKPEVVAPGVNVRSSVPGGGYASNYSGTSMSCPHVAGAIALLRQYNPNATADAVKTALMESAHDLGTAGEDNTYGWGIINVYDAMLVLEGNNSPHIRQWGANYLDGDDNIPGPGETGDIVVTLQNTGTSINGVYALISSADPFVQINGDSSFYGNIAMNDTLNNAGQPFSVTFDEDTPRGRTVHINLEIYGDGGYSTSGHLQFTVGSPAEQAIAKHNVGDAQFTISNFGHYGLANGSILYFPGGIGFKYPFNRQSNLFEGGLLIGTGPAQISDCVRDEAQNMNYDFLPTNDIAEELPGSFSDQDFRTSFNDQGAVYPMGLEIQQNSYMWDEADYDAFAILEYLISNFESEPVDVVVAHFSDWDFPWPGATSDRVNFDREHNLGYMFQNPSTNYRGVSIISEEGVSTFRALQNADEVYPPHMTDQDKWDYMTAGFVDTAVTMPEDASCMIATGPLTIGSGETKKVVFTYIGGDSFAELQTHAINAYEIYWATTSVDDGGGGSQPRVLELSQNYPNPFNAVTAIRFSLPEESDVRLDIYNLLGRRVATLLNGKLEPGNHVVSWNAHSQASGIYFYKLSAGDIVLTKRMTLLK